MTEAYKGEELEQAFSDLERLLHAKIPAIPTVSHTVGTCALLFRMVARLAGSLHQQLRKPRNGFPYKLFKCLNKDGSSLHSILESPPCLHDDITRKFVEMFNSAEQFHTDTHSEDLFAQLLVLADLSMVDIAGIESRHASVRRVLEGSSVHSWRANLAKLSSDFVIRQSNNRRSMFHRRLFNLQRAKKKRGPRRRKQFKNPDRKHRGGGGGAHRAFFREQLLEHGSQRTTNAQTLFKEINEKYRNLSPEQLQYYKELGELGTLSYRSGHLAFGAPAKTAKRKTPQTRTRTKSLTASSSSRMLVACGNAGPSAIIPQQVSDLDSAIARQKAAAARRKHLISARKAETQQTLRKFAREKAGLPLEDPVLDEDEFDHSLSQVGLPHPTEIPNCSCWEVFPPNAKLTKD